MGTKHGPNWKSTQITNASWHHDYYWEKPWLVIPLDAQEESTGVCAKHLVCPARGDGGNLGNLLIYSRVVGTRYQGTNQWVPHTHEHISCLQKNRTCWQNNEGRYKCSLFHSGLCLTAETQACTPATLHSLDWRNISWLLTQKDALRHGGSSPPEPY